MVSSSHVVVGAVLASCTGGRACRRREARPIHGGRVQSSESGASRKVTEVMVAKNLGMAHLVVRSTCGGGRPKSGEVDLTVPAGQGLGSSLGRRHDLSGKLSKGSGEVGGLREWLATAAVLGRGCLLFAANSGDLKLGRE
jgi:hypothetical protein